MVEIIPRLTKVLMNVYPEKSRFPPEDFHDSECAAQVLSYCVASLVIKNK